MAKPHGVRSSGQEAFSSKIGRKEGRKLKARRERQGGIWYGLGLFGIVGWSVMIPICAFVALGVAIDARWPGPISWTLTLLVVGVVLGCLNAWYWLTKERQSIEKEHDDD